MVNTRLKWEMEKDKEFIIRQMNGILGGYYEKYDHLVII